MKKDFWTRFYEILPGFVVWSVFISLFVLSFIKPLLVIYIIIIYDIFWFFRIIVYMQVTIIYSWFKYKKVIKVNWTEKLEKEFSEKKKDIYHAVIFTTLDTPYKIVKDSLEYLYKTSYDKDKMIVVLSGEGLKEKDFKEMEADLISEFSSKFLKFKTTIHYLKEDEMQGKGSNAYHAGKILQKIIDDLDIYYGNVIISNFDIDTYSHKEYFSYLTYLHLTEENPERVSYQPMAIFNNNFWETPFLMRIVARSTTFWLLYEFSRDAGRQKLFTFASHSMNFKALVEVGFWHKDIVTEDSRIGLQCINHYNGDYKIKAVYIPLSMDCVSDDNIFLAIKNQYKQMRRWAYGMENFPYIMKEWFKNKKMPFDIKFKYAFHQFEGGVSWASSAIIMFLFGLLPLQVINYTNVSGNIITRNAPDILKFLMNISLVGLIICSVLSFLLVPKKEGGMKVFDYIFVFVQWIFLPVTMILFGSFPAIEAYTRLMFKKYLGFWSTPKTR